MGLGLLLSALCIGYPLIFMPSYISESTPFPKPLTKAEETRLFDVMKQEEGDARAAKEKLISHNLRLVAHVAKKYSNTGIDHDDLISIGSVGLIKAIDTYSPDRSTRLGTYAARCIENAIHPRVLFLHILSFLTLRFSVFQKIERLQRELVRSAACTLF